MSDLANAHKPFAADAFNAVWSLIDKTDRSLAETREMIRLSEVSYHHWLKAPDHTSENLSIGTWQLARVYTLANEPSTALHYAAECLRISEGLPAFYLGYAHEALARAAALNGDRTTSRSHLDKAKTLLPEIPEDDNRSALQTDLDTIS